MKKWLLKKNTTDSQESQEVDVNRSVTNNMDKTQITQQQLKPSAEPSARESEKDIKKPDADTFNGEYYLRLGIDHFFKENYEKALNCFQMVLYIEPTNIIAKKYSKIIESKLKALGISKSKASNKPSGIPSTPERGIKKTEQAQEKEQPLFNTREQEMKNRSNDKKFKTSKGLVDRDGFTIFVPKEEEKCFLRIKKKPITRM